MSSPLQQKGHAAVAAMRRVQQYIALPERRRELDEAASELEQTLAENARAGEVLADVKGELL